jgi:hypothetical protein
MSLLTQSLDENSQEPSAKQDKTWRPSLVVSATTDLNEFSDSAIVPHASPSGTNIQVMAALHVIESSTEFKLDFPDTNPLMLSRSEHLLSLKKSMYEWVSRFSPPALSTALQSPPSDHCASKGGNCSVAD